MFGIYDRGLSDSPLIQTVTEYIEQEVIDCSELYSLQEYAIVIAHVSDEEWDSLIEDYSFLDNIRVRMTIGGDFRNKPSPKINKNDVYVFHLVLPALNVSAEDWKEILSGLSNSYIVKALVRGENPMRLKRFFVHEVQEQLSALTILCEGYLAVHAETEDNDIHSALQLMKWTEFRESERGQKVIQSDLNQKMDAVQQPNWWSNVFEQDSFYEDVKKEWKDTTSEEEIPPALNDLLEAIHSGDAVIPPKIVSGAYCVLEKGKLITSASEFEWQTRHKKFNHDWLKYKFLNSFDNFIVQLQKERKPDLTGVSKFLAEDFPTWKSHRQDAQWIVESFEDKMSPQQLLNSIPLNRCNGETREWLGYLLHELWLSRYAVKEKSKECQEALKEVNNMYEILASELEQSTPIGLTKLIALHPQFCELKEKYKILSKTLSILRGIRSYG